MSSGQANLPKQMSPGWGLVDSILKRIVPPTFPDREFVITRFGAAGDGTADNRNAFARAITACAKAGGGRVIIPPGRYLTNGPIHLESNVNLHVEEDAEIVFGNNPSDYLPMVLVRWEGTECHNYSPLVYAQGKTNIAITGKGTLNGQAQGTWALWKKKQNPDKATLRQMGNDGVPVEKRTFGPGHFLRPSMIQFFGCRNVLVEDVNCGSAKKYGVHIVGVEGAHINNVFLENITIDKAKAATKIEYTDRIEFRNVSINGELQ
jgi:polygalacturonase